VGFLESPIMAMFLCFVRICLMFGLGMFDAFCVVLRSPRGR